MYVAELMGTMWSFQDSAERVVYRYPDGSPRVVYKGNFYKLLSADEMKLVVNRHLGQGSIIVGGVIIDADRKRVSLDYYPFIDITSSVEHDQIKSYLPNHQAPRQNREAWESVTDK